MFSVSAMLHGSAPAKHKTSATLHGNARTDRKVQMGHPKRISKKCPKPLFLNAFGRFSEAHWSTQEVGVKKWISRSGRQRALMAMVQSPSLFQHILQILLFGIHLLAALLSPSFLQIIKKPLFFITFRTPSLDPSGAIHWNIKN